MGSLIEELKRREAAARAEADRLRARVEELSGELARAEEQVSRLVITREEVMRALEEPSAADVGGLYPGIKQGQFTLGA
jgi:chromosome segregation ATPase